MEQQNEKQMIFFKDLLFCALYQWKKILIVGVAFAVLLGAVAMLSGDDVSVGGMTLTPETQAKVEQLERKLEFIDTLIEKQEDYIANSPCMTLDPYAVYTVGFHVFVEPVYDTPVTEQTPVEEDTATIIRAYRSLLTDSTLITDLAGEYGIEPRYLREAISQDLSIQNALGIQIRKETLEQAQELADRLIVVTNESVEDVSASTKPHKITIIPFQNGPVYEASYVEHQSSAYQKLTTYENERLSITTELKRYAPTQLTSGGSNPLLFAIVGAFLGACLVVGIAWVGHLGSGKVYSARVLENRTGIRVLGCVRGSKKRWAADRWLRKLEGRADNTQLDAVAVNIRNRCEGVKQLLVMGCFNEETMTDLVKILEQAGISCKLCSDPAVKADALENLPSCDAVVLAEVCGSSRYDAVEWAMQTVCDHNKPLLGCVLIDG